MSMEFAFKDETLFIEHGGYRSNDTPILRVVRADSSLFAELSPDLGPLAWFALHERDFYVDITVDEDLALAILDAGLLWDTGLSIGNGHHTGLIWALSPGVELPSPTEPPRKRRSPRPFEPAEFGWWKRFRQRRRWDD